MASGRRIAWSSTDRYSPVQDRAGVVDPTPDELPPVHRRVRQRPSPYSPAWLDEREILRVTYQGDDRCQLRCPGCYTGERLDRPSLPPAASPGAPAARLRVPWDDFTGQMGGLGPGLQDFYLLGAEPTMDPEGSARKLKWAADAGMSVMSITNGAVSAGRFDRTFGPRAGRRRPLQGDRQPRLDRSGHQRRAPWQSGRIPADHRHDSPGGGGRHAGEGADHCLAAQLPDRSGNRRRAVGDGRAGIRFPLRLGGGRAGFPGPRAGPRGPAGLAHAV